MFCSGLCWSLLVHIVLLGSQLVSIGPSLLVVIGLRWSPVFTTGLQRTLMVFAALQWFLRVSAGLYWSGVVSSGLHLLVLVSICACCWSLLVLYSLY